MFVPNLYHFYFQMIDNDNSCVDSASSTICNECVSNVNNFYLFKQKVLNVQNALSEPRFEKMDPDPNAKNDEILEINVNDITDSTNHSNTMNSINFESNYHNEIVSIDDVENVSDMENTPVYIIEEYDGAATVEAKEDDLNGTTTVEILNQPQHTAKRAKKDTSLPSEKFTLQVNECLICPAVLSDILQLNDHIQTHDPIQCKVCRRPFQRYANLKRHFASVHSKPKPFVCDLCGLGFSFSVNLQTHAALHYSGKIKLKNVK